MSGGEQALLGLMIVGVTAFAVVLAHGSRPAAAGRWGANGPAAGSVGSVRAGLAGHRGAA